MTLTSFNMAASVSDGANSDTLTYDTEHSRIKQVSAGITASTTTYLNDPASGAMEEKLALGANTTWRDYIMADGHMVAQRTVGLSAPPAWGTVAWSGFQWTAQSATTPQLLYFTLDQLGSVSVVTDRTGFVVERDSYDAWGKRRNIDGTAIACTNGGSYTSRGFTGQEMMDNVCLINFNARLYDPSLGRFMSADPTTETVYNLQILNRYAYVINNPLSLTDPSGLCFLGCFWKSPIFIAIVGVAIALFVPYALWNFSWAVFGAAAGLSPAAIAAVAAGGILSGAVTAGLSGGSVLQGALFGGLSAIASIGGAWLGGQIGGLLANGGIGQVTAGYIGRAIGQGLTGGLASEIEGGNFGSGFLAAGIGSLAGRLQGELFDPVDAIAAAALGGIGSVLGGGKFANGAITGALAYAVEANYSKRLATGSSISGPEIPASQRQQTIGNAIATYQSQNPSFFGFLFPYIENDYQTYAVVNDADKSDIHLFDSLQASNSFIAVQHGVGQNYVVLYGYTDPAGLSSYIYAGAAYSNSDFNYNSAQNALFTVYHEVGHQLTRLGGGGCYGEACANNFAVKGTHLNH